MIKIAKIIEKTYFLDFSNFLKKYSKNRNPKIDYNSANRVCKVVTTFVVVPSVELDDSLLVVFLFMLSVAFCLE
jgi:hypothetical protein